MFKVILCAFLILLLVPFSEAFSAESTDTPSTLTLSLNEDNIHVYQDSDGHTVVVGLVENNNSLFDNLVALPKWPNNPIKKITNSKTTKITTTAICQIPILI